MNNTPKKYLLGYAGNTAGITEEDAKKLTHINLAFGQLNLDGSISVDHLTILEQLPQIRSWNPEIRIVLSVVPHDPDAFTVNCATPQGRQTVARSCAAVVQAHKLDGIDLDWEYPCVPSNGANSSPADKHNFTLLCEEIRRQLDAIDGSHYLLTIAAGADLYYVESVEIPELMKTLDYICLMTYDLKCGFHALAGHHTQLYSSTGDVFRNSCDQALRLFHAAGAPKEKLLMGAAFYSRKWEGIQDRNHGLLQICKNGGGYGPSYHELVSDYIDKNGYTRYWDDEAKAPYLFDGSTFLSYDDPQSLKAKCEYVNREGYAGIFYWEHVCDATRTLLDTLYQNLNA
ncbi:MAG: chitinase [Lachnospiraceae bacterium]|nr:chitinase [Lachnospiraceae bacterium]